MLESRVADPEFEIPLRFLSPTTISSALIATQEPQNGLLTDQENILPLILEEWLLQGGGRFGGSNLLSQCKCRTPALRSCLYSSLRSTSGIGWFFERLRKMYKFFIKPNRSSKLLFSSFWLLREEERFACLHLSYDRRLPFHVSHWLQSTCVFLPSRSIPTCSEHC